MNTLVNPSNNNFDSILNNSVSNFLDTNIIGEVIGNIGYLSQKDIASLICDSVRWYKNNHHYQSIIDNLVLFIEEDNMFFELEDSLSIVLDNYSNNDLLDIIYNNDILCSITYFNNTDIKEVLIEIIKQDILKNKSIVYMYLVYTLTSRMEVIIPKALDKNNTDTILNKAIEYSFYNPLSFYVFFNKIDNDNVLHNNKQLKNSHINAIKELLKQNKRKFLIQQIDEQYLFASIDKQIFKQIKDILATLQFN